MENNNTKFSTLLMFLFFILPVILILAILIIITTYLQYKIAAPVIPADSYPLALDRLRRTLIMYEIALPFTAYTELNNVEILRCMAHARATIPKGLFQENINTIFTMHNPIYALMNSFIIPVKHLNMEQQHVAIHYFSSVFAANELALCNDPIVTDEKVIATFKKYLTEVTLVFKDGITEPIISNVDTPSTDFLGMLCSFFVLVLYVIIRYITGY